MRAASCLTLAIVLSAASSNIALAGGPRGAPGAGPAGVHPVGPPSVHHGPRVIDVNGYGPPIRSQYGPPIYAPNVVRPGWRNRHWAGGYYGGFYGGYPVIYQNDGASAGGNMAAQPVVPVQQRAVVLNYNGAPPLWQGDAGYAAQPAIYDVRAALRDRSAASKRILVVK